MWSDETHVEEEYWTSASLCRKSIQAVTSIRTAMSWEPHSGSVNLRTINYGVDQVSTLVHDTSLHPSEVNRVHQGRTRANPLGPLAQLVRAHG